MTYKKIESLHELPTISDSDENITDRQLDVLEYLNQNKNQTESADHSINIDALRKAYIIALSKLYQSNNYNADLKFTNATIKRICL